MEIAFRRAPSPPLNPFLNLDNQLEKHLSVVSFPDMANVEAFKAFLKERQTGLIQRTAAWVKARQHTIGASEISALTGASPFDTPASLLHKKLHPPDLSKNMPVLGANSSSHSLVHILSGNTTPMSSMAK